MISSPTLLSLNQLIISPGSTCDKSLHCYDNLTASETLLSLKDCVDRKDKFLMISAMQMIIKSMLQMKYNTEISKNVIIVCAKDTERSKICTNYRQ